jgi:SAM-dependent methyltransferase
VTTDAEHWERWAERWAAWARRPDHDSYWRETRATFAALLPPAGRKTLDLGCGEGRVARDLAAAGHDVVGIDISETLVGLARQEDPRGEYLVANAAALPFTDDSFDLVVAFNTLMDFDDMPGAVREAARVLEPGGRMCVSITHPMRDAGRFASNDPEAPFRIDGPYFGKRRFELTVKRDEQEMRFHGWTYPLEDYARAFEEAGFLIEALREPPDPGRPIPNFLFIRGLRA